MISTYRQKTPKNFTPHSLEGKNDPPSGHGATWLRSIGTNSDRARATQFAAAVTSASIEVLYGLRQAEHLRTAVKKQALRSLTNRAQLAHLSHWQLAKGDTPHPTERISSVHSCYLRQGVYEVAVVTSNGSRYRASTVRVERSDGQWIAAALHVG